MKKVLVFLVLLVASTFFSISVFADNMFQQPIGPYESLTITLSNGYYNVSLDPGEAYRFNWSVSNLNANYIYIDSISTVSAGSSDPQIYGTASVDISSTNGGWASFINTSDQTISGLDLSVSVTCTLYNSNDSYQTPRASLSCTNGSIFSTSFVSNAALNVKLNQILSELSGSSSHSEFLGSDYLFYFDNFYFNRIGVRSSGSASFDSDGYITISDSDSVYIYNYQSPSRLISYSFSPGVYLIALSYPGSVDEGFSISFSGVDSSLFELSILRQQSSGSNSAVSIIELNVKEAFSASVLYFNFSSSVSGILYGGVYRAPEDYVAGQSMNPNQDQVVDDVDKAGEDQAAQEEQMWSNINTYKGSLDFSLDGWDDASSGLSYVRDVFMIIWDNSPTEIITLSLMLGIAMLSIGRGVGAAVRASSRRRGDD